MQEQRRDRSGPGMPAAQSPLDLRDLAVRRAGVAHLRGVDRALGAVLDGVGPLTAIPQREQGFSALVAAIVGQQISVQAADAILARVADHLAVPAAASAADDYGFEPQHFLASTPEELHRAGLSRAKARYVLDLAARLADGRLDLERLTSLSDDAAVEELTTVKGIGRWTAELYLLFSLGRSDILPAGDLGIRKAVQRLDRLPDMPDEDRVRRRGARWQPYRSLATLYLWRGRRVLPAAGESDSAAAATDE